MVSRWDLFSFFFCSTFKHPKLGGEIHVDCGEIHVKPPNVSFQKNMLIGFLAWVVVKFHSPKKVASFFPGATLECRAGEWWG